MSGFSSKTTTTLPTHVRGLYNFSPTDPEDLPFKAGDIIKVINASHKDWWRGSLGNKSGIFPVNYVEPISELAIGTLTIAAPTQIPSTRSTSARALSPFISTDPVELSFQEGDSIELVDTRHKDWWIGKLGSRTGAFPANFVNQSRPVGQIIQALPGTGRLSTAAWSTHSICSHQAHSVTLPFPTDILRRLTFLRSLDTSSHPEEIFAIDFTLQDAPSDALVIGRNSLKLYSVSLRDLSITPARSTYGTLKTPLSFSSIYHRAATIAGDHLVLLSNDFAFLYRLHLNTWEWKRVTITGTLPSKRQGAGFAVCTSTQLFLFGGLCGGYRKGVCVNDLWMLDIGTNSTPLSWGRWDPSPSSDIPSPRHKHSLVSRGLKLYLFGGEDTASGTILSDTFEFDLATKKWTKLTCSGEAMPRAGHSAVVIGDSMYVFGGLANRLPYVGVFNIPSSTWHHLTDSTLERSKKLSVQPIMVPFASKIFFFVMPPLSDSMSNVHVLDTARMSPNQSPVPSLVLDNADLVEILKPVGGGGYCDLFIGVHLPTKLKLALKRPRLFEAEELMADARRRFRREADLWSAFRHDNILPFLGVLEKGDEIYLTSYWMARGDLSKFLKLRLHYARGMPKREHPGHGHQSSFSERDTILGIASGIAYLHSHDFVHGDIKSPNVILADDGHPLLCDFGLTKALDTHVGDTSTTMKGVGSRRWQSPELFLNLAKSFKSDVYAFAMTIVEILTCIHPFPTLQDNAVLIAVFLNNERPPFEPASRFGVNYEPFWQLASRCWSQRPEDRLSMQEVVKLIGQIPS